MHFPHLHIAIFTEVSAHSVASPTFYRLWLCELNLQNPCLQFVLIFLYAFAYERILCQWVAIPNVSADQGSVFEIL